MKNSFKEKVSSITTLFQMKSLSFIFKERIINGYKPPKRKFISCNNNCCCVSQSFEEQANVALVINEHFTIKTFTILLLLRITQKPGETHFLPFIVNFSSKNEVTQQHIFQFAAQINEYIIFLIFHHDGC